MLFQPALGRMVIRTDTLDLTPEPRGVVHLPQVHQLVQNQIVTDERGRLNESPVQGNGPSSRAGTPTRSLIAHCDPTHGQLMEHCVFKNPRWEFLGRQPPQMPFNHSPEISGRIGHFDDLASKSNVAALSVDDRLNPYQLSTKMNLCSEQPFSWASGTRGEPLQLPLEPGDIAFGKSSRFRDGTAAGNCHSRGAVWSYSKHIPPRTRIADQDHWNLAVGQRQKLIRWGSASGIQVELKLHPPIKRSAIGVGNPLSL